MIALVDYGAGNLTSVRKALTALGADFEVPRAPDDCHRAHGLIVPGVGHFGATEALTGPWRQAIGGAVQRGTPLLGICVGMQWLFEGSEEAPGVPGLAVLPGRCARLRGDSATYLKVPHVGWNSLDAAAPDRERAYATDSSGEAARPAATPFAGRLLAGLPPESHVYFTHSYAAPVTPDCVASTSHGERFASVVERGRIFGVQFHPEKSGDVGLLVLRNYLDICRSTGSAGC